jgi:hypothetical protein
MSWAFGTIAKKMGQLLIQIDGDKLAFIRNFLLK